uniref:Ribonuclease PIN domain-containing protein n=1 Tax=Amphimedon queenslandica TaxID=400682 RepID=A0A1X7U4T9_AMPQE
MNKRRVSCLVVDSGPFIKGVALQDWSQTVYTIRDVISEIKDSETRQRLQVLPCELILREPSQEYIKHVVHAYNYNDVWVFGLILDTALTNDILEEQLEEEEEEERGEEDGEGEDDDDSWITPDNYQSVCDSIGGLMEETIDEISVGCMTTDYAMQNVLLQIGLNVVSIDGMLIKRIRTYAQQCKACFKFTHAANPPVVPIGQFRIALMGKPTSPDSLNSGALVMMWFIRRNIRR